jgi:lipoprotein-anchoring transpeptidase ErfK/SrfK
VLFFQDCTKMLYLRSLSFAFFTSVALGACVPDPAAIDGVAGGVARASLVTSAAAYGPITDAGLNIPAVPVEKVPAEFRRQTVDYASNEPAGTIIINPAAKQLYFITGRNQAIRYGISVGKAGFEWSGEALITDRKTWPTWTPPKEMIDRKPDLAQWEKGMPGGLQNPLGARALYLTTNGVDYGYRIHGTPDWFSIGKNASSGCIRMINQDVLDLYSRVPDGAKVIVLRADGSLPKGLTLPPQQPKKPNQTTAAASPAPETAKIDIPTLTILPPPNLGASILPPAVSAMTQAPAVEPIVEPAAEQPAVEPAACLVKNADGSCLCEVLLVEGLCPTP